MSDQETQTIQDAFVALKEEVTGFDGRSTYDSYVLVHQRAMDNSTLMATDSHATARRNSAHGGPAFLPWHRVFLARLELDLQRVAGDDTLGLPYWDWTEDAAAVNQAQDAGDPLPALSFERLAGPPGTPLRAGNRTRYIVTSGRFGFDVGDQTNPDNWWVVNERGHFFFPLERRCAQNWDATIEGPRPTLPETAHVTGGAGVLKLTAYDSPPWDELSQNSFRNVLEGFAGPGLHNIVHRWVGGSMGPGTSPNDPLFFLHHSNVERIWAAWQDGRTVADYLPTVGGPCGHNAGDMMYPWNGVDSIDVVTPADVWDYTSELGYDYDDLPQLP